MHPLRTRFVGLVPVYPLTVALVALLSACADDVPTSDADIGMNTSSVTQCTADSQCSDGVFCNGTERCAPANPDADATGCITADPPCITGQVCNEASLICLTQCEITGDADGDGQLAPNCGGTDCDDSDARRYPGNTEVCDVDDIDEDCDPTTFGFRDLDGDGVGDAACCNDAGLGDGTVNCGTDCDDNAPATNPFGTEVCDGLDNDCDQMLDEGVLATFYRDSDGDGFGDPTMPVERECGEMHGDSTNGFDCDDTSADVRPGAQELCDGRDNNCDGIFERDLDNDGHLDPSSVCAPDILPVDDCNDFLATTYPGAQELCDGLDNDCDNATDERPDVDASCGGVDGVDVGFCLDGDCFLGRCEALRGDCNDDPADGCEVDLATSSDHCGACDAGCPLGEACVDGRCSAPTVSQLTLAANHACVRTSTGKVACWGENDAGQLGSTLAGTRTYAAQANRLPDALDVAVSDETTCVIATDRTVHCIGGNQYGERGIGNRGDTALVTTVQGIDDAVSILGHGTEFCVQRMDDSVWCWGWGAGFLDATSPTQVSTGGAALTLGSDHLCGIGGPVSGAWCVGADGNGQLGDNTAPQPMCNFRVPIFPASGEVPCHTSPTAVDPDLPFTLLAAGSSYTCASDGAALSCWGRNNVQQALLTPPQSQERALQIALSAPGSPTLVELVAGSAHTCGLADDGSVRCWGDNSSGQLGRGTVSAFEGDGAVVSSLVFDQVDAHGARTCGLDEDGVVWCWGQNGARLGDRGTDDSTAPVSVVGFDLALSVGTGGQESCALMRSGGLQCWGASEPRASRVEDLPADDLVQVVHGGEHKCGLRSNGELWCWGRNAQGQLGRGDDDIGFGVFTPAQVTLPQPVARVAANAQNTCALLQTGEVYCWGSNTAGVLGADMPSRTGVPTEVAGVGDVVDITMGQSHACALRRVGTIACWGAGTAGQLGDGSGGNTTTPVVVSGIDDAVAVAAGTSTTCAIRADRTAWCWGDGTDGELGGGEFRTVSLVPQRVYGLTDVRELVLSGSTPCAVNTLGEVYCWGDNGIGGTGVDATTASAVFVPTLVDGVSARTIGGGGNTNCALGYDGAVTCWGDSGVGQAGRIVPGGECIGSCGGGGCFIVCPTLPNQVPGL